PYSTNHTFLVRLGPTSDASAPLAVYKPAHGERPLYDFPSRTLYRREVAAYEVSRALGWDPFSSMSTTIRTSTTSAFCPAARQPSNDWPCSTSSATTPTARPGTASS